jgi:hypothetical protein
MQGRLRTKMASNNDTRNVLNPTMDEAAFAKSLVYLRQLWSYIEIRVEHPGFEFKDDATLHEPQPLADNASELEFVYPIYDHGDRLLASKDIASGACMIKMHYTIEKMINILYQKYLEIVGSGGVGEFNIYLDGELLAIRKAFEVIINLPDNWVVMNFEPGNWGSNYLSSLQKLYDKGFSYPPPAPRDTYRHSHKEGSEKKTTKNK